MTSSDKDYRFMAANDLMAELQKDSIKLDDESERKVVKMILKLLEDKNGEVQNLAVKCLGPLVNKVKDYHITTIVDVLCNYMLSEKEQLRDMGSLALKTVIMELPTGSSQQISSVCKNIVDKLSKAITELSVGVQLEALDITCELLSRFGGLMLPHHSQVLECVLPQLASPRMAVRKRSTVALSLVCASCTHTTLPALLDPLLAKLQSAQDFTQWDANASDVRTVIQCLAACARAAGHRWGAALVAFAPLLLVYVCAEDCEAREHCLQAWEALLLRCPVEVAPHVPQIVEVCLKLVTYDPNYNYSDDASDGEMSGDDECSDSDFSDDDDVSWKVRRAAAKCLEAVVSTRTEMLPQLYTTVSPQLIARFKEREQAVKVDVFSAYVALLKASRPMRGEGVADLLRGQVPSLVRAVERQLKEKSPKTRAACFDLLTELLQTLPGALTGLHASVLPAILACLCDKQSTGNMKIITLNFLKAMLSTHDAQVFQPHLGEIIPPLVHCATVEPFYKITAESLDVLSILVKIIRPLEQAVTAEASPHTLPVYECCLARLKAIELDQEVKEKAISCMALIVSHLGKDLGAQLPSCLPIFLERLHNEITRLTTVRALSTIAASPLDIDLRPILPQAIPLLAGFLRKNQRCLRLCSLQLLEQLVKKGAAAQSPQLMGELVAALPPLLSEADMHVAHSALALLAVILRAQPRCVAQLPPQLLQRALDLLRSPLLQGPPLAALQQLFEVLVRSGSPGLGYQELLQRLLQTLQGGQGPVTAKQAHPSVAAVVATLTLCAGDRQQAVTVVRRFLSDLSNPGTPPPLQAFSLLAVGEIGKRLDLSALPELLPAICQALAAADEDVKSAAAVALGHVCCGNLDAFLPYVLKEIAASGKRQYLLLHCVKEIINVQSASPAGIQVLENYVRLIWDRLFPHAQCEEEGTRNVVAECLGKITLFKPIEFLPLLQQNLQHPNAQMRNTIVTAIKFTMSDQPSAMDAHLAPVMADFLSHIADPDLHVRRVSLLTLNCVAHNKPKLVRDLLQQILPEFYDQTRIRKELIREVEMGPFKHPVDDGLDIRKAAFECMYTLLDTCLDKLDIWEFLDKIEMGLKDHYDIKMLTYLMLTRLVALCPAAVLQRLEPLVDALRTTVAAKVKAHSVKQEYEKQDELKRAALRCLVALSQLPDADRNIQIIEFINYIKANEDLQLLYESVNKDSNAKADNDMDLS